MNKMLRYILPISVILTECYSVQLTTRAGVLIGSERKSRDSRTYHAYTGIPYAKPPVGNLRLRNPEKHGPWEGTLDASKPVAPCIQNPLYVFYLKNMTFGVEDCLFLNVYVPQTSSSKKLPVMVYFHGGGFRNGNPGVKDSPDYLMDEDILLVTVQYRFSIFGFLSLENSVMPGNFALKDQALALKWVHEYIADFGGDPNEITIMGESAGAGSTHLLGMSPLLKGIIKRVISQSGVVNHFWGFADPGTARPLAEKVIQKFGCPSNDDQAALECLQNVDAIELSRAEVDFLFWEFYPVTVFRPVQEPSCEGAILDFDPFKVETNFPWITGTVEQEGTLFRAALEAQDASITQEYIDNFDEYTKKLLYLDDYPNKEKLDKSIKLAKEKYFQQPMTVASVRKDMAKLLGDAYFSYPMVEAIKHHKGPVFQYRNNYRGGSSLADTYVPNENFGSSHVDEVLLLFNSKENFPRTKDGEEQISRMLVKMWANFAKCGNPSLDNLEWPELRASNGKYFDLTDEPKVTENRNLKQSVYDWWSQLPIISNKP